ncbi:hypothetical protein [Rhizobium gallicum]|nr:hypothetical protein [Rhizobium gallicum]
MTIEQHIEELRAELKSACDAAERHQIEAELAIIVAEQDGRLDAEPPF